MDIKVPAVGESVTEAEIGEWLKKSGDYVKRDEVILTLETDKASVEVVAEDSGVLKTMAEEGDTVEIGAVVASLDTSAKAPSDSAKSDDSDEKNESPDKESPGGESTEKKSSGQTSESGASEDGEDEGKSRKEKQKSSGQNGSSQSEQAPQMSASPNKDHLSPAVRKAVHEKGLDPSSIEGTGRGGRLTKEDVMNASAPTSTSTPQKAPSSEKSPSSVRRDPGERIERVKMTTIRRKIAERLVNAQQTAAILTTFNEVDMSALMNIREQYKEPFEKKHGVRLGFMGFFVKATIEALKEFPAVNASLDETDILYKNYYNIGVAVSSPKGLVVPVLKDADQMSLAEIEQGIKNYAIKARDGKITIDDMSDGSFTISNGGVFGSLMSTPILNPPQSGILGMHKIEKRPVVIEDQVQVRPMMYLALSYDHRMIDGKESVSFLVRIKENIEDPSRMLLQV